uniref:CUB domain-containing protein n=1 Tax=Panagrolaimus davidi TaxID=227884 RepID=A0A914PBV5_9BILA
MAPTSSSITVHLSEVYQTHEWINVVTNGIQKGNAKPTLENGGSNKTLNQGIVNTTGAFTLYYEETDPNNNNGFLIEYTITTMQVSPYKINSAISTEISVVFFSAVFFVYFTLIY